MKPIQMKEQIEQASPQEKRQFKAQVNHYLGHYLASERRKKVAEAQRKIELGELEDGIDSKEIR